MTIAPVLPFMFLRAFCNQAMTIEILSPSGSISREKMLVTSHTHQENNYASVIFQRDPFQTHREIPLNEAGALISAMSSLFGTPVKEPIIDTETWLNTMFHNEL